MTADIDVRPDGPMSTTGRETAGETMASAGRVLLLVTATVKPPPTMAPAVKMAT